MTRPGCSLQSLLLPLLPLHLLQSPSGLSDCSQSFSWLPLLIESHTSPAALNCSHWRQLWVGVGVAVARWAWSLLLERAQVFVVKSSLVASRQPAVSLAGVSWVPDKGAKRERQRGGAGGCVLKRRKTKNRMRRRAAATCCNWQGRQAQKEGKEEGKEEMDRGTGI